MLVLAVAGISNCYSPPNPACGFLCNASNSFACPEGFTCSHESGVCVSNSAPMTKCYADASPTSEGPDADRRAPMITGTSPTNGATDVDINTSITISANQPLANITSQTVQITDGQTQIPYSTSATGNDLTLHPATPLTGGHVIVVTLNGVIGDTTQSPLEMYTFSFTTIDTEPPQVFSSTPASGDTNIAITSTIAVTFTEPVSNVDATSFTVSGATTASITANADGTVWTFTPVALTPATTYTVTLSSAITDRATTPNHLTATTFSFTTM
ncbi:MAG: Ig-like domain-containing protein [Kofleriaceae bacterium]